MTKTKHDEMWLDAVSKIHNKGKPCHTLHYCPYGSLAENFPLIKEHPEKSCTVFGHNCPVYTVAEPLEESWI